MTPLKVSLCAVAATIAMGGVALAQDKPFSFNVGVTSDYVFRGISQTNSKPALQAGADLNLGMFYAGVWGSNVKFLNVATGVENSDPTLETDIYGGVRPKIGEATFDFGVIYYGYVEDKGVTPGRNSYLEGKAAVSGPVGPATLGVAFYYSPQFPGNGGKSYYYELNGSVPLFENLTLSGAAGHQAVDARNYFGYTASKGRIITGANFGSSYATWNVGLTWAFSKQFSADVRYYDTEHDFGKTFEPRGVVSLKATF